MRVILEFCLHTHARGLMTMPSYGPNCVHGHRYAHFCKCFSFCIEKLRAKTVAHLWQGFRTT